VSKQQEIEGLILAGILIGMLMFAGYCVIVAL
jgi:hypothetical protein